MAIQGYVDRITPSDVAGWAIEWDKPTVPVEVSIIVNGTETGRCKAELMREPLKAALGGGATGAHEFSFKFSQPLPAFRQSRVEVWAADSRTLLPNGRQTIYPKDPAKAKLIPILLTSTGRSGTTMLMQEFAGHPEIVVADVYPFEIKLASYYAAVWNVLSANTYVPTQYEDQFAAFASRDQIIGRNPWNRANLLSSIGSHHIFHLLSETFPLRLGDLFRATVEEYYTAIAGELQVTNAVHLFAEKGVLDEPVRQSLRMMFGGAKEIVMVRDPRDYICSAKDFWKHDINGILSTMRSEFGTILNIFKRSEPGVFFVRYEDLVTDPVASRNKLYDFLGCKSTFQARERTSGKVPKEHRTSASPAASIGRFRNELDPGIIALCNDSLSAFMKTFDYKA